VRAERGRRSSLLFSRTGFTAGVADEAVVRPDVELIGIDRLYGGS
jgi:hypothetical protein